MAVIVSGMVASARTFFADSPVVVTVQVTGWGKKSPFTILRLEVIYNDKVVGSFKCDTGGQTTMEFDISTALKAIWSDYDFSTEVYYVNTDQNMYSRAARAYKIKAYSEYMDTDGELVTATSGEIEAGKCVMGGWTEWERSVIRWDTEGDVGYADGSNLRNGDASTKPVSSPERVGSESITSWTDVSASGTQSYFWPATSSGSPDSVSPHAPIVIRDSIPYADFLFVNRRGALETCSALVKEQMQITKETKQYARAERPTFAPSRTLMAIGTDGRRSWQMSSGKQTRDWVEWWTMEFLGGRRRLWWMKYKGSYVPVIVEPAKKTTTVYDRSKQNLESVEFTVTLALEG